MFSRRILFLSDEEKKKMRQELWNKFFQEQVGIKASDLSEQLEGIRAVYEEFGKLLGKVPWKVEKVSFLERDYLSIWLGVFVVVIDMETNSRVTNPSLIDQITNSLGLFRDEAIDNVSDIVSFYREHEAFFNTPSNIKFVVRIEKCEASSELSISLWQRQAMLRFLSPDQTLYETIFCDEHLVPCGLDTKKRMSEDELKTIKNDVGNIVVPYSVIPKELFELGILKREKAKEIVKGMKC